MLMCVKKIAEFHREARKKPVGTFLRRNVL